MKQQDAMEVIRELLSEPKTIMHTWPEEVMKLKELGRKVTPTQVELAQKALARKRMQE